MIAADFKSPTIRTERGSVRTRFLFLHSLLLALLNIVGLTLGFFIWRLAGGGNQAFTQGIIAATFTFFGYWLLLKLRESRGLEPARNKVQALGVWLLSACFLVAVFLPLHYFAQGYGSSWGNVAALLRLAIPTNFLAAFLLLWRKSAPND